MPERINISEVSPDQVRRLSEMNVAARKALGDTLIDLVNIRVSQINGCALCLDMHVKEAKIHGERELRVYHLPVWRESALYNAKERAALEWAEAVTQLGAHGVSDEVYAQVRESFSEKEIGELTFAVALINSWNRLSVSLRRVPGSLDKVYHLDRAGLS